MNTTLDDSLMVPEDGKAEHAKNSLMDLLIRELQATCKTPMECPRCHATDFTKRGRDRNGTQRYLCHNCNRSFTSRTGRLLALSKLDMRTWMSFARCMANVLPLELTARHCKVSVRTAWFMRMRVCEIVHQNLLEPRAGRYEMGLIRLPENHKGNHHIPPSSSDSGVPCESGSNHGERQMVDVSFGTNQYGDTLFGIDSAIVNARRTSNDLVDELPDGSIAISSRGESQREAFVIHEQIMYLLEEHRFKMRETTETQVRDFLSSFNGVATRYLDRYLDWYRYRKQLRDTGDVPLSFLIDSIYGTYRTRRNDLGNINAS